MVSRPWPISVAITASAAVMVWAAAAVPAVFLRFLGIPAPGWRRVCRSAALCRGVTAAGCWGGGPSRLTNRRSRCGCAPPFPATLAELNMHRYRTHTCGALRESDIGIEARLSGWCHRIRDHGGVLFIDLPDH